MKTSNRRGYTLIELIVTVLIIGILTSIAVPQYLKTVETGKADDAAATVNMIGTTNKMFSLDHAGSYVTGTFTAVCGPAAVCPGAGPYSDPCALVACKYLADQDWGNKAYTYQAANAATSPATTATANRTTSGPFSTGPTSPYSGWGYTVAPTGVISAIGTTPPPTY